MNISKIIDELKTRNVSQVAKDIGVSHHTLHRLIHGITADPHHSLVVKLHDYLSKPYTEK